MQTKFNEHLPWWHRLETGPAECAERLNNNHKNNNPSAGTEPEKVPAPTLNPKRSRPDAGTEPREGPTKLNFAHVL